MASVKKFKSYVFYNRIKYGFTTLFFNTSRLGFFYSMNLIFNKLLKNMLAYLSIVRG